MIRQFSRGCGCSPCSYSLSLSVAFHTKDLRDLLPEIVSYVFSLGGWAEDHEHLGFWCPWAKGAGGGAHLVELLGARGPLMQHLIRDSKDANLFVWPRWSERDMPARVFRLHRNPRLAPFQGGTSRFLAMWVMSLLLPSARPPLPSASPQSPPLHLPLPHSRIFSYDYQFSHKMYSCPDRSTPTISWCQVDPCVHLSYFAVQWPCLIVHHICMGLCRWLNPTVFEYYMICFAKALVQRWADPSASRPDTAVYFHVAQEYVNATSPETSPETLIE